MVNDFIKMSKQNDFYMLKWNEIIERYYNNSFIIKVSILIENLKYIEKNFLFMRNKKR